VKFEICRFALQKTNATMPPKRKKTSVAVDDDDEYEPSNNTSKAKLTTASTKIGSAFPLAATLVKDAQENESAELIASAERDNVRLGVLKNALKQMIKAIDAADRLKHQQRCAGCSTTEFGPPGGKSNVCHCGMAKFCDKCAQEKSRKCADPYACSALFCSRSKCSRECDYCKKVHCWGCLRETKCYRGVICFACRHEARGCTCSSCRDGYSSDDG
jgi:hypothetical protein